MGIVDAQWSNTAALPLALRFVCFNSKAVLEKSSPEAHVAEALSLTRGWRWDMERIIASTPLEQVMSQEAREQGCWLMLLF